MSGTLKQRYVAEAIPALKSEFGYTNAMQVPRLEKIVVNIGLGEALTNSKAVDAAVGDLALITGQRAIVTKAKKSIATFKVRDGNPVGAKVTLRGERIWDFFERLT
ncbi:MAG: 50S ribosomal protein L5, partial [Candidatus Limnocylindrus sp.]